MTDRDKELFGSLEGKLPDELKTRVQTGCQKLQIEEEDLRTIEEILESFHHIDLNEGTQSLTQEIKDEILNDCGGKISANSWTALDYLLKHLDSPMLDWLLEKYNQMPPIQMNTPKGDH